MKTPTAVPDLELESLSVEELLKLHARVEKIINRRAEQASEQAWAILEQLEKYEKRDRLGTKVQLGMAQASPLKGRRILPKFRNPANHAETWAGRGRKPAWVIAALEAGKTLDELRIKANRRE
jgi:DNA-binding protein H-NS